MCRTSLTHKKKDPTHTLTHNTAHTMPPDTQHATPLRWPTLGLCGVVLQHITALCRWSMGGRHVEGHWCYSWKRALVHFPVNLALCIGAYSLKDCIVDAMTPNTPLPSAVFLNVSISNSNRTIRATPDHFPLNDTHFFDLSSLYSPPNITDTNTSTSTNTATTTLTATATSATATTSPPRPKPPPPASGFIIIKPRAHQ